MSQKITHFCLGAFIVIAFLNNIATHFEWQKKGLNPVLSVPYNFGRSYLLVDEYRFFSPSISDGFVIALIAKTNGKYERLPIFFYSFEMVNRMTGVYHSFYEDETLRDIFAHNFTLHFMEQYEGVDTVFFSFNLYKLPEIQSFKQGAQPGLEEKYRATITLNK